MTQNRPDSSGWFFTTFLGKLIPLTQSEPPLVKWRFDALKRKLTLMQIILQATAGQIKSYQLTITSPFLTAPKSTGQFFHLSNKLETQSRPPSVKWRFLVWWLIFKPSPMYSFLWGDHQQKNCLTLIIKLI